MPTPSAPSPLERVLCPGRMRFALLLPFLWVLSSGMAPWLGVPQHPHHPGGLQEESVPLPVPQFPPWPQWGRALAGLPAWLRG